MKATMQKWAVRAHDERQIPLMKALDEEPVHLNHEGCAQCVYCKKWKPWQVMQRIGKHLWRCKSHSSETILKAKKPLTEKTICGNTYVFDKGKGCYVESKRLIENKTASGIQGD